VTLFWPIAAAAAGLVVGSFLNVCIHRMPRGVSVVFPASHCPACGAPIAPYDNVPVLAWLWLRGRCRVCRAPISARYPAVEAANGLLWALAAWRTPDLSGFAAGAWLSSACLALLFIDWDWQLLPDAITYPSLAAGLILSFFRRDLDLRRAAAGALFGAGLLAAVALAYRGLTGREGLGWGDVKMLGMIGAFVGPAGVLLTLLLASLAGSLVGGALMLFRGATARLRLPLGCFLALAAIAAMFFGPRWIEAYRRLL
jgi:leader peptidase (prepilin peptidase) / N-methyltransferase